MGLKYQTSNTENKEDLIKIKIYRSKIKTIKNSGCKY